MNTFKIPVVYSDMVKEICLDWDEKSSIEQVPMTRQLRKEKVEHAAACAVSNLGNCTSLVFDCFIVPRDGVSKEPQRQRLMISISGDGSYLLIHIPEEKVDILLPGHGQTLYNLVEHRKAA